ncbi:MAG: hypothetical protein EHM42_03780 [Planctomycetaceae bacterium]|nr:MAG: hypothetical protein EHM42_03780 [Planctomycetaceae bacterium]
METITRRVRDLEAIERCAVERLVGHGLRENQQLIIQVVSGELGDEEPSTVSPSGLPAWCNVYEGMTGDEIAEVEQSIIRSKVSRSNP